MMKLSPKPECTHSECGVGNAWSMAAAKARAVAFFRTSDSELDDCLRGLDLHQLCCLFTTAPGNRNVLDLGCGQLRTACRESQYWFFGVVNVGSDVAMGRSGAFQGSKSSIVVAGLAALATVVIAWLTVIGFTRPQRLFRATPARRASPAVRATPISPASHRSAAGSSCSAIRLVAARIGPPSSPARMTTRTSLRAAAHGLTEPQIKAVATYLDYLE